MSWTTWEPGTGWMDETDGLADVFASLSSRLRAASGSVSSASRAVDGLKSDAVTAWQSRATKVATGLESFADQLVEVVRALNSYAETVRSIATRASVARAALEGLPGVAGVAEGGMSASETVLSGWAMSELTARCVTTWAGHLDSSESLVESSAGRVIMVERVRRQLAVLNDLSRQRLVADQDLMAACRRIGFEAVLSSDMDGIGGSDEKYEKEIDGSFELAVAMLIARAWEDQEFLLRTVNNPQDAFHEVGYDFPDSMDVSVQVDSQAGINVILPPTAAANAALPAIEFGLEHEIPVAVFRNTETHTYIRIPPAPTGAADDIAISFHIPPINHTWNKDYMWVGQEAFAGLWVVGGAVASIAFFQVGALAMDVFIAIMAIAGVSVVPVLWVI